MESLTQTAPNPSPAGDETPVGPDLNGRLIGDFRVLRRLGAGGMGQVYLAEQVSLKRNVALKVLKPDLARNLNSLARFKAEAEAGARLTHANVVQVYYIGEVDGLPFMAMEYVEGRNLREYLAKKGPPDLPLALGIMRQVAAALTRAGEMGIVHRDIKPDNILLTRKGEVKVADFGLSRVLREQDDSLRLTQSGVTMGTPLYMAPEQAEGKPVDCRADIYSFGVTCYHLLAGEPPFRGATAIEVALQHIASQPPQLAAMRPDLPAALCALVHKMMAKKPEDRYPTARDVLREIVKLREGLSGQIPVVTDSDINVEPVGAIAPTMLASSRGPSLSEVSDVVRTSSLPTVQPLPSRRWLLPLLVGLSLLAAVGIGTRLARPLRLAPSHDHATDKVEPVEADANAAHNDEVALRKTADLYLAAGPGKDVGAGTSLCLKLATLYLDQHRLDEAEKFFTKLDGLREVRSYRLLGHLGLAIVHALRDQPRESNQLFREVVLSSGVLIKLDAKKVADANLQAIWHDPSMLFWVAQALRYNRKNGLTDDQVPLPLQRLLSPGLK